MAKLEITEAADRDLTDIYVYTFREYGERQADRYLDALRVCCNRLAENPGLARSADRLRPGYRRFEHASHVIFLTVTADGVRVIRVLHRGMEPKRHL